MSSLVLLALRGLDNNAPHSLGNLEDCREVLAKLKALTRATEDRMLVLHAETGCLGDVVRTCSIRQEEHRCGTSRRGEFEVGTGRARVTLSVSRDHLSTSAAMETAHGPLWSVAVGPYKQWADPDVEQVELDVNQATVLLETSEVREWLVGDQRWRASPPNEQALRCFVAALTRALLGRLSAPHEEEVWRADPPTEALVDPGEAMVHLCLVDKRRLKTNATALGRWLRGEAASWRYPDLR